MVLDPWSWNSRSSWCRFAGKILIAFCLGGEAPRTHAGEITGRRCHRVNGHLVGEVSMKTKMMWCVLALVSSALNGCSEINATPADPALTRFDLSLIHISEPTRPY